MENLIIIVIGVVVILAVLGFIQTRRNNKYENQLAYDIAISAAETDDVERLHQGVQYLKELKAAGVSISWVMSMVDAATLHPATKDKATHILREVNLSR